MTIKIPTEGALRMETQDHYCRMCGWMGCDLDEFDPETRRQVLLNLKPGDVVPAGKCPRCASNVFPHILFEGTLPTVETYSGEQIVPEAWKVRLTRLESEHVFHMISPAGFGCEITAEISGGHPTFTITPFDSSDDFMEAEAVAHLRIGAGHVVFRNSAPVANAVVATENSLRTTKLISLDDWVRPTPWDHSPE